MKKLEPIETDENGEITYNLGSTAADMDWIRAGRLVQKAKAGDKAAAKELEELENTPMLEFTDEEMEEIRLSVEMEKAEEHYSDKIKSVLLGVAVGDALGVPVEFNSRQTIRKNPVTDMRGHGTYNQPPGTWSDDSSLTFCLAEALTSDFDLNTIGKNFVKWADENFWTPRGNVFDIGITIRQAIDRLAKGVQPDLAGGFDVASNGNGSLMRILPLLFHIVDKPIDVAISLRFVPGFSE
jgi:hypothetical protein